MVSWASCFWACIEVIHLGRGHTVEKVAHIQLRSKETQKGLGFQIFPSRAHP
jgi:hypothetical protein